MRILVTGGAGFIGGAVIRHILGETGNAVTVLDKFTYAANEQALLAAASPLLAVERGDIRDEAFVAGVMARHDPDAIMHLAAETHVDRSIDGPAGFIETNVVGTRVLLDAALVHWRRLGGRRRGRKWRWGRATAQQRV